jgi:hypothetical protein
MEHWSVQHPIAAVELFIRTESITATQRGFGLQFQTCDVPSCNMCTLLLRISNWHHGRSVKDSKPQGYPHSVCTLDIAEQVREAMLWSPHRSAWGQALALGLKGISIQNILHKDLNYPLYKTQVTQELSGQDKVSRLQFSDQFLDLVNSTVNSLLMSDEAHFYMSGYINKQNCWFWAANNPPELH